MSADSQMSLLAVVQFALHADVPSGVAIAGIDAVAAIADYANAAQHDTSNPIRPFSDAISRFQHRVLHTMLFGSIQESMLTPLADCLLALIFANYSSFCEAVSAVGVNVMDSGLVDLVSSVNLNVSQSANRHRFRDAVAQFVRTCRPLLQVK
uniref:Exportin-1 C-terminal domain-containing protein n=1 Tax=Spongospora subterranea TaxID=70186 RepID=A0A0H5QKC3_9EUKA|eukprot:CRZ02072.1 hypothetical protein [Spongospora subterranea]